MAMIGIIGGGLAGAVAGASLAAAGHQVTLFEKARGLGGRLATRRFPVSGTADHGAQFFKANQDPEKDQTDFAVFCEQSKDILPWFPENRDVTGSWLVGTPTMNTMVKRLAEPLIVKLETQIKDISNYRDGYLLTNDAGETFPIDACICTAPAPQSAALLKKAAPDLRQRCKMVEMVPSWTVMLAFKNPLKAPFTHWSASNQSSRNQGHIREDCLSCLGWVARNSSKPGREAKPDSWTLQATAAFSLQQLEAEKETVIDALLMAFQELMGEALPTPTILQAHRWRYAFAKTPVGTPYLADPSGRLMVAGDWLLGKRVGDAYQSGLKAARALAKTLS